MGRLQNNLGVMSWFLCVHHQAAAMPRRVGRANAGGVLWLVDLAVHAREGANCGADEG
jgi:hypothetical protein